MRYYFVRNSLTGFLMTLVLAYFVRLWALEHGYQLLSVLATVYIFILLLPLAIILLILLAIFLVFLIRLFSPNRRPFWQKNKDWTR